MWLIATIAESFCLIFGSLIAALVLCMLLWRLLLVVKHPEMGAFVIAAMAILVFAQSFTHSPFLRLTFLFALSGTAPLWLAGREWRKSERAKGTLTTKGRFWGRSRLG